MGYVDPNAFGLVSQIGFLILFAGVSGFLFFFSGLKKIFARVLIKSFSQPLQNQKEERGDVAVHPRGS